MRLLVVRHGIAMEREEWAPRGESDDLRPLTRDGARKMRAGARALLRLVPELELIATSPLVRARQTAEIVQRARDELPLEETPSLRPEASPASFGRWLRAHREVETVAAVGHEPHLGLLVSWFLAGGDQSFIELKKGGACLIEFSALPGAGRGRLAWLAGASMLRQMRG